jgi:hypothetical protein
MIVIITIPKFAIIIITTTTAMKIKCLSSVAKNAQRLILECASNKKSTGLGFELVFKR